MPTFNDPSLFANLFNANNAQPSSLNAPRSIEEMLEAAKLVRPLDGPSRNVNWPQFRSAEPTPSFQTTPNASVTPAGLTSALESLAGQGGDEGMTKFQLMLKLAIPLLAAGMAFKKGTGPAIGGFGEGYMGGERQASEEAYRKDLVQQRRDAVKQTHRDRLEAKAEEVRRALAEHRKAIRDYDDKKFLEIVQNIEKAPGGVEHLNALLAKGEDPPIEYTNADGDQVMAKSSDIFGRVGRLRLNGQFVGGTPKEKTGPPIHIGSSLVDPDTLKPVYTTPDPSLEDIQAKAKAQAAGTRAGNPPSASDDLGRQLREIQVQTAKDKQSEAGRQRETQRSGVIDSVSSLLEDLDPLLTLDKSGNPTGLAPATRRIVGGTRLLGAQFRPGSPELDAEVKRNRLQAEKIVDLIREMKTQSRTGATGFGQLNREELAVLTAAATRLSPWQSEKSFYEAILQIRKLAMKSLKGAQSSAAGAGGSDDELINRLNSRRGVK